MSFSDLDLSYMKYAMKLAGQGRGFTEPNPMVGAVVVKDNNIISSGNHCRYGSSHAEQEALNNIEEAQGADIYVNLEPCSHYGKTPPCSDLIIKKGIKRVVIANKDPNKLVNGKGIKKLRENGIKVETGCLKEKGKELNRHYFTYMEKNRPYILLKSGLSIDGKFCDKFGKSKWITSSELRSVARSMRGEFSAILCGSETVRKDNPLLTLRDDYWKGKRFFRIILNRNNDLDVNLKIFDNQDIFPTIVFSSKECKNREIKGYKHFFVAEDNREFLDLNEIMSVLYKEKISSLMVEGGSKVIDSFLRIRLFDELAIFTSNKIIGGSNLGDFFISGYPLDEAQELDIDILEFNNSFILRGRKKCLPE